jgi:hypothetical protein
MAKRTPAKRTTARPARSRRQASKPASRPTLKTKKATKPASGRRKAVSAKSKKPAKKPVASAKKAAAPAARARTTPKAAARPVKKKKKLAVAKSAAGAAPVKRPFLDRERRTVVDETLRTPPSSLDLDQHGSAARTGRATLHKNIEEHTGMSADLASGDADVDLESAYFSGEEAPGGDNPTPDQNVVDDIGKALGVQYQDAEELQASDKVVERDQHRWELDPASAEDYRDRDRDES